MSELQIQRAHWHDYSDQGYYMLTFTAEDRRARPFGIIAGDSEDTATVALTPLPSDLQCVNDGSLLILSPWHDRPKSEKVGKADCEVMNKVCEVMERM